MLRNLDLDRLRHAQACIDGYLRGREKRADALSRGVDAFAGAVVINGLAQALVMAGSRQSGEQAAEARFAATMLAAWLVKWRRPDLPAAALGPPAKLARFVDPVTADDEEIVAKVVAALLSIDDPVLYCALSEEAAGYLRQVKIFAKARKAA